MSLELSNVLSSGTGLSRLSDRPQTEAEIPEVSGGIPTSCLSYLMSGTLPESSYFFTQKHDVIVLMEVPHGLLPSELV